MANVKGSVLSKVLSGSASPSPSLAAVIDDWVRLKQSKTDNKSVSLDLSSIAKYLPDDASVQQSVLAKIIEYYASIGKLGCFSNFDSEGSKLLSSWRNVKPEFLYGQYNEWGKQGVDTRMTSTEYGDILNISNEIAGRLVRLGSIVYDASKPVNFRQTNVVKMKRLHMNLMITPTVELSGSTPPLADSEMQIVDVLFFVDTMALLSNKSAFGVNVKVVDTITGNGLSSVDENSLFSFANAPGSTPAACYAYPVSMPNPITHNTRFHILCHKRFPVKNTQWVFDSTNSKMVQGPGDNQYHSIDIPLSPITMPFASEAASEPYMNQIYMLLWGNTSTTTSNGYFSICHYQLKTYWEDCGE